MDRVDELAKALRDYQIYYKRESDGFRAKILQKEKEIEKLEKRQSKFHKNYVSWIDLFLKPLANEVLKELNKSQDHFAPFRYVIHGPFGLRSCVVLEFKHDELYLQSSMTFVPIDVHNGVIHYQTDETTNEYERGSIGYINGFNFVTAPIQAVKQIYEHIKEHMVTKTKVKFQ